MDLIARPMVYAEAKECVGKINANMTNIRGLVLELYEREGWTALGYASWRECVTAEFKQGENYLYKQLAAAQMEKNICTTVQIPERQLRPLSKLEPQQQREAWQQAVDTAPDGKVTAAHVYKIVKGMTEPKQKTPPVVEEDSDAVFQLKRWWKRATKKDKQTFLLWVEKGEGA